MRSRPLLVVLAVLSFSLLVYADEWNKSFNLNGKPDLRVKTGDGNIRVEPWDKDTVEIRITTQNWKIGDGGLQISDHQNGNSVELDVPTSRNFVNFGWNDHQRHRIDIEVHMPRLARVDLHTGDGNIVIRDMKGDFTIKSGDGHQQIDHIDGTLDAGSGDGSIKLTGRFDKLNVRSGDGTVDARVLPGSKMTGDWSMRANDGSIHLELPEDFSAELEALTGDGHIDFDMRVQMSGRIGRKTIRGKIGNGGMLLNLHTGDGCVKVGRLEGSI